MQRQAPVHYLRPNERNWTPAACIFLDTEARVITPGDTEVLSLRLWCARYVDRRTRKRITARHVTSWGRTQTDLVRWVEQVCRNRDSVHLYCHNLAFDLVTTRLPLQLASRGWTVSDASIGGRSPWMRLARGRLSLTLLDSGSWLPVPLQDIGERLGIPKPALPAEDDTEAAWLSRCGHDVDILATAMLDLMGWWDRERLGNWSLSGPATGWNAMRHAPNHERVVIDPDPEAVERDRPYVHGGRRGVWIIGERSAGPFYELDFRAAYPSIAAAMPHPVGRAYPFDSLPLDDEVLDTDRWGVTARCLIATQTARWPLRVAEGTWYPVGTFWADLAGPDIAEAARLGALVRIGPGEAHRLAPFMAPWARWCLRVQDGVEPGAPAVAQIAAKAWGRSVIGKWAAHGFTRQHYGPAPGAGWGYEPGWDHDTQTAGGWVDIAGERFWTCSAGTVENGYPAVLAWVESEVRVRLNRVIAAIGEAAVLQCDTDGLIVAGRIVGTRAAHGHLVAPDGLTATARLAWVLDCLDPVTAPLTLRVKSRRAHVSILGPQHILADGQRRFAGLSRHALLGPDGRYRVKSWPGLSWQMSHGSPAGYVRPTVISVVDGPYPTGWILRDKRVVPVEAETGEDDVSRIVPWHRTRYAAAGMVRADVQHPSLDALI